jgi:apolipoprotein N-acyltransferase
MLKSVLDYILVEERLDMFFFQLAWIGPALGILFGFIVGMIRNKISEHSVNGFLWGLIPTGVSVLWWIYNLIVNHFGIDSVAGLLVNLGIFACLGLIIGLVIRFRRTEKTPS